MSGRTSPWRLALIAALIGGLGGSTVLALGGSAAAAGPTTTAAPACPAYNPPNTMTLVAGTPQSAQLGTPYATDLQVSISNSNGCPVTTGLAGIPVTFAVPSSGPGGTFASSGTNAVLVGTSDSGIASAPEFTANRLAGGFIAVATSDYGTVGFSLVNTASGGLAFWAQVSPIRPMQPIRPISSGSASAHATYPWQICHLVKPVPPCIDLPRISPFSPPR